MFLFDALEPDEFEIKLDKGKSVGAQFVHLCSTRRLWLVNGGGAELDPLPKNCPTEAVRARMVESGELLATAIGLAEENGKRACGFSAGTAAFVAYLSAHEGFHWAQVELAMRQAGRSLDKRIGFDLWDWKAERH